MKKGSKTRYNILEKGFDLIYKNGYQATSIDEILATTKVTKGAFYYHFKTKDDMGVAIIKEIVKPIIQENFIAPLQNTSKPIEEIYQMIKSLLLEVPFLKLEYGCPVSNLTQEMTPWNIEFTNVLNKLILEWQIAIENCIKKEVNNRNLLNDETPKQVAFFIISSYWGIRNFGKITKSKDCYLVYLKELKVYLSKFF